MRAASTLFAILVLAHLLAAIRPSPWTWGVHQFSFLPLAAKLAFCAGLLLLCVPAFARRAASLSELGSRLASSWRVALPVAILGTVGFALGRLEFPFLGDGLVWTEHLDSGTSFYHFEVVSAALFRFVAGAVAPRQPHAAAGASSILLGFFYVIAVVAVCRSLWRDRFVRGVACVLLLAHPTLLLYFGYVESYPLVQILMLLFAHALHRAAAGRIPAIVPAALLGLAMSAHLLAASWIPGLWALAAVPLLGRRGSGAEGSRLRPLLRAALASLVAFAVAGVIIAALGASPLALLHEMFGARALGAQEWRSLASAAHLANVLDAVALLLGPAFILIAYATARGVRTRDLRENPAWLPVAWLLVGSVSPMLLLESRIGGARDWDLFASWSVPAILLTVEMFRIAAERDRTAAARATDRVAAGWAMGLAVLATAGWLWVQIDPALAAQRFVVLQRPGGPYSDHARAYASETLGVYYRDRDWTRAADAWREAARLSPGNPRYHLNLGNAAVHTGNLEEARGAFARAYGQGVRDARTTYNLALACLRTGRPQEALRYLDEIARAAPPNALILQTRAQAELGLGRAREALTDLDRALQLDARQPDLHYYRALALLQLDDAAGARSSLERALDLAPSHVEARRALEQLGR